MVRNCQAGTFRLERSLLSELGQSLLLPADIMSESAEDEDIPETPGQREEVQHSEVDELRRVVLCGAVVHYEACNLPRQMADHVRDKKSKGENNNGLGRFVRPAWFNGLVLIPEKVDKQKTRSTGWSYERHQGVQNLEDVVEVHEPAGGETKKELLRLKVRGQSDDLQVIDDNRPDVVSSGEEPGEACKEQTPVGRFKGEKKKQVIFIVVNLLNTYLTQPSLAPVNIRLTDFSETNGFYAKTYPSLSISSGAVNVKFTSNIGNNSVHCLP